MPINDTNRIAQVRHRCPSIAQVRHQCPTVSPKCGPLKIRRGRNTRDMLVRLKPRPNCMDPAMSSVPCSKFPQLPQCGDDRVGLAAAPTHGEPFVAVGTGVPDARQVDGVCTRRDPMPVLPPRWHAAAAKAAAVLFSETHAGDTACRHRARQEGAWK